MIVASRILLNIQYGIRVMVSQQNIHNVYSNYCNKMECHNCDPIVLQALKMRNLK